MAMDLGFAWLQSCVVYLKNFRFGLNKSYGTQDSKREIQSPTRTVSEILQIQWIYEPCVPYDVFWIFLEIMYLWNIEANNRTASNNKRQLTIIEMPGETCQANYRTTPTTLHTIRGRIRGGIPVEQPVAGPRVAAYSSHYSDTRWANTINETALTRHPNFYWRKLWNTWLDFFFVFCGLSLA